jgi:endonuclease III
MKQPLELDAERAEIVVKRLLQAFESNYGIFEDTSDLLEFQIPTGVQPTSLEHARFLFYLIAQDYGTKSARLYAKAKALYAKRPQIFEPKYVVSNYNGADDPKLAEDTGVQLSTRFPKETAKRWYENSEKLLKEYEGDPRKIFTTCADARIVFERIRSFRGFGPKIGGLLLRTFLGCKFAKLEFVEEVLVPVDVHDSRIAFYTGAAKTSNGDGQVEDYHEYAQPIQHLWSEACNSADIDWLQVDRALWLLGSRGCVNLRCAECRLSDICWKGQSVLKGRRPPELSIEYA